MKINNEDFSGIVGKVDEAMFENLINYFDQNNINKEKMILLLHKKEHLNKVYENYSINIENIDFLSSYENFQPNIDILEFLYEKNYSKRYDFYKSNVLKEYNFFISNNSKNKVKLEMPEKIKNKIRFMLKDPIVKNDNFSILSFNPIIFAEFFNEMNINMLGILKKLILGNSDITLRKENALVMVKSGIVDFSFLNEIFVTDGKKLPLYLSLFYGENIEHLSILFEGRKIINPEIDLSLFNEEFMGNVFYWCDTHPNYIDLVFNLLPNEKIITKNSQGNSILHHAANANDASYLKQALNIFIEKGLDITIKNAKGKTFISELKNINTIISIINNNTMFDVFSPEYTDLRLDLMNLDFKNNNFYRYQIKNMIISGEKKILDEKLNLDANKENNTIKKRL